MEHSLKALLGTVRPWTAAALLLLVALLTSCGLSSDADPALPEMTIAPGATSEGSSQPTAPVRDHPNLDSALNQLLVVYEEQGMDGAQAFAGTHGLVLAGQSVEVTIVTTPDQVDRLVDTIECLGAEVQADYEERVEAFVPLDRLASVAELPEVQLIREPQRAVP